MKKIIGILIAAILINTISSIVASNNYNNSFKIHFSNNESSLINLNETKLTASDGEPHDFFGTSVSINGDTAIIGAPYDDEGNIRTNSGSAYVFTRIDDTWVETQKLTPADGKSEDQFGKIVSISGDTAIIGAIRLIIGTYKTSVYVFTRIDDTWVETQKLTSSDEDPNDFFSLAAYISGDTAIIGAPYDDNEEGIKSGSAYVFTRIDDTWVETQKLTPADGETSENFGRSVSISDDIVLIGGYGCAYFFERTGDTWAETQKITASNLSVINNFGHSVSISGDTAVIEECWTMYIFTRINNTWVQHEKIIPLDLDTTNFIDVSISKSGDTAILGGDYDESFEEYSGFAYVFNRYNDRWVQQQKLTSSDLESGDWFGRSVSISGNTALIGAPYDDDKGERSGSAYVFRCDNNIPEIPTISGESSGEPNIIYEYSFVSDDPDGDNITYVIDWGENTSLEIVGPYLSGVQLNIEHNWSEKGTYNIKAKARDIHSGESPWAIYEVSMPKLKLFNKLHSNFLRLEKHLPFLESLF